jgi:hypothetical protein
MEIFQLTEQSLKDMEDMKRKHMEEIAILKESFKASSNEISEENSKFQKLLETQQEEIMNLHFQITKMEQENRRKSVIPSSKKKKNQFSSHTIFFLQ